MSERFCAAAPPLSAQMRDAAQTLAGQIEGGAFEALTPDGRCDLRELSMTIARWSDLVETAELARSVRRWPRRRLRVWPGLVRAFRWWSA